jgi:alpha-D-ribose 1-methylphosphonate 5-triphosphate synthase subunit PhnH
MLGTGFSGFADRVTDCADVFRAAMEALASPGTPKPLASVPLPPSPLPRGIAALALALADQDTPLWLDPELGGSSLVHNYLRVQTGATIIANPARATFALVARPLELPTIGMFCQGSDEDPDRSTTVLIAVTAISTAGGAVLSGPGIPETRRLAAAPLPASFWTELRAQRARFPRGVDVFLATNDEIVGLPRTLRIEEP